MSKGLSCLRRRVFSHRAGSFRATLGPHSSVQPRLFDKARVSGSLGGLKLLTSHFHTRAPNNNMSGQPNEPEFQQAFEELTSTLKESALFKKRPELERLIPIVSVPERVIQFRVVWENDKGELQVNQGYRVQFNSALGPYKGGLRLHPTVNLSILKFLGFEQIFKNALTGLNMGGGKGGSDFNPKGKSDAEIRRFCYSFMLELSRHIGANTDIPAGDIGTGSREVGFLFGAYKKYRNQWEGVLTGKGLTWGGSLIRPEATGYGVVYYVEKMIEYATQGKESLKGKRVVISGAGNVSQYAALKCHELGATVLSLSDSQGVFVATGNSGFTPAEIEEIAAIKLKHQPLSVLESKFKSKFKYIPGSRPWKHFDNVDVAIPGATQNEVSGDEAQALLKAGCRYIAEGSNMGSTLEAINVYEASRAKASSPKDCLWYAPGKAANAGGVAVSGLEMAQNSQRLAWSREEVDAKLKDIMSTCFDTCLTTAKDFSTGSGSTLPSLVQGANIAAFIKVADAMIDQGDFY